MGFPQERGRCLSLRTLPSKGVSEYCSEEINKASGYSQKETANVLDSLENNRKGFKYGIQSIK